MHVNLETGMLQLGEHVVSLSEAEIKAFKAQRNSTVPGDRQWSDEKSLAFVLWQSGNSSLPIFIQYCDNLHLTPEF